jgi:glutamate/tyrosine decarboxylase-like PLP-dependent enzyme
VSQKSDEETLDPQDWKAMRNLGHRMIDDMFDHLKSQRNQKTWVNLPDHVKTIFSTPVPTQAEEMNDIYEEFLRYILPFKEGNTHPRFFGWVEGTGTPFGMLAELLAAGLNPNNAGGEHAATYVENQVVNWFKEIFNFPSDSSGIIVSGGSMANLVGLTVARNVKANLNIRGKGLQNFEQTLTIYGSEQMHSSIQKAVELLGVGSENLRKIVVNEDYTINISALKTAIQQDRTNGNVPFCVVGNVGTTNTGAIDQIDLLADICEQENLWFHIDGAFGAMLALNPHLIDRVKGMDRADSLAFDFHKWMYIQYEAGCTLIRNRKEHKNTFSLTPDYLIHKTRGLAGVDYWFSDFGVELSRGFKSLKIWMCIKHQGINKFGRLIEQNINQANYLASLVQSLPELELLTPVTLNIVCFRFNPGNMNEDTLNRFNDELLLQLQESGDAILSSTVLHNKLALRAAITNHRTTFSDLEVTVNSIIQLGKQLRERWQ